MSEIILITLPTIQYGGYFLLTSVMDKGSVIWTIHCAKIYSVLATSDVGVIVILSVVCQMLADTVVLPSPLIRFSKTATKNVYIRVG